MTALTDLDPITSAVLTQLRTVPNLDVFDGIPTARMDSDGRVHPYAAVYPTGGRLLALALCGQHVDGTWSAQITCAGGDRPRLARAVARVRAALTDWAPTVTGLAVGPITERDDFEPQTLTEQDVSPPRLSTILQVTADVTQKPIPVPPTP